MYSLQQIIDKSTTLEQIKKLLADNQQDHFIPLIDNALVIIFNEELVDVEALNMLLEQLESVKNFGFDDARMNDEYYQTEQMYFDGLSDELKRLVSTSQPVIESAHLATFVLVKCINVLNLSVTDNVQVFNSYKQAVEALTIARYATAYLDLCDDHYVEIHRDRLKKEHNLKLSQSVKGKRKSELEQPMRDKYAAQVYKTALQLWSIEPLIPVGIMAEVISENIMVSSKHCEQGYRSVDKKPLAKYFRNQTNTPQTALINGRATNNRTNPKHIGRSFSDIAQELLLNHQISL